MIVFKNDFCLLPTLHSPGGAAAESLLRGLHDTADVGTVEGGSGCLASSCFVAPGCVCAESQHCQVWHLISPQWQHIYSYHIFSLCSAEASLSLRATVLGGVFEWFNVWEGLQITSVAFLITAFLWESIVLPVTLWESLGKIFQHCNAKESLIQVKDIMQWRESLW